MGEKFKSLISFDHEKYDCIFDDPKSKLGSFLDKIIIGLILFFPVVLIFESIGNNAYIYVDQIYIVDAFISIVFAFEYFIRFFESKHKKGFFINPKRIIDLLAFLPFFLGFIVIGNYLKVLRILRVLRILKLFREIPLTSGFVKALKDYRDEYKAVFTLYFVIMFLGSFFVYFLEHNVLGTDFKTVPDAIWWGVVTTTTVGYGDMILHTAFGKIIGGLLVLVGPLMRALISAVTIMVFMETSRNDELKKENRRGKECKRCGIKNTKISNFCTQCGKKFSVVKNIEIKNKIY